MSKARVKTCLHCIHCRVCGTKINLGNWIRNDFMEIASHDQILTAGEWYEYLADKCGEWKETKNLS